MSTIRSMDTINNNSLIKFFDMPTFVKEDTSDSTAILTVGLTKADYSGKVTNKLKEQRKKGSFKGFRAGKAPMSFVKKVYGKAALGETIDELVNAELTQFLKETDLEIIGQPIPQDGNNSNNFSLKLADEFTFKFEIGWIPAYTPKGVTKATTFEKYEVVADDETLEKAVADVLERSGEHEEVEAIEKDNDKIMLDFQEMDGDAIKGDGVENTFSLLLDMVADETIDAKLRTLKVGDEFIIENIFGLLDKSEEDIKKHVLNIDVDDEVSPIFKATISSISSQKPAELNDVLFNKFFEEGTVKTEEEFRAKIKEDIVRSYDMFIENELHNKIFENLVEQNQFDIPKDFISRWTLFADSNANIEAIEKDWEESAKSIRWSFLKNRLAKEFNLTISEEDMKDGARRQAMQMMGTTQYNPYIEQFVDMILKNEEMAMKVQNEVLSNKLLTEVAERITTTTKTITTTEADNIMKEVSEKAKALAEAEAEAEVKNEEVVETVETKDEETTV